MVDFTNYRVYNGRKFHQGGRMNKSELVAKISEGAELTKVQAEKALNCFIATTTAALKAGEKITLVGFGTFSAVSRAARTGRNPQTGKSMKIAAKTNGKFSPGKALKDLTAKPAKAASKAKAPAKKK
ncbi:MAG: HU family DNA-binding protein [Desulfuromonadaceae bacterium]|nr:HU family DNA-binding protein [Desulfuromonadaceae bacterium]MDD5106879.1 HU family DNA-binding protein [Desulfuromonadaceae bacterium]